MLLSNEEYLNSLSLLFSSEKGKGTVFLTQKRYSYKDERDPSPVEGESCDISCLTYKLLFRATDGKKTKISTLVDTSFLIPFFSRYMEICKSGMRCLKKRDRKKQKAKKNKVVDSKL
ncbi:hypothetical protein PNEG_03163 [Pneumocystis murina B123]|uniref:Signal recognition particle subunit SRP14 n=1 Tax=Pneumocystis murina (strain B123) TaxID=1069680 RepID=M7NID4_PNEMU|nr:hypothetical protein PNEG_03163 [Pneumocystis murina B123]EMR08323.1 hypothetical protein PNEG_03163 [Pneumocystis murina B123]